jgi:hypothetical protein
MLAKKHADHRMLLVVALLQLLYHPPRAAAPAAVAGGAAAAIAIDATPAVVASVSRIHLLHPNC